MPVITALPEQRVLLHNISWETYERLLAERLDSRGTRFAYDDGELEIMVVYAGHESANRNLADLVGIVAGEEGTDLWPAGSTTFRRKDLDKGFEPDSCFYLGSQAATIRGKSEIDLTMDPPPDLVIEVDITRSSLNRFRIFAAIGVPEVWRYDGERVIMYRLANPGYHEILASLELPPITAVAATELIDLRSQETWPVWRQRVIDWVRSNTKR